MSETPEVYMNDLGRRSVRKSRIMLPWLMWLLWARRAEGLDNGLSLRPPMGWNTWERFRCNVDCERSPDECISEWLIKRTAEAMVQDGYKSAGYEYIVIDDCWLAHTRDVNRNLQPNCTRFPSGIHDLSRYVHSLGLKFGIYANYGTKTCAGYPGTFDDIYMDADLFAKWEVDFVKLDGCYSTLAEKETGYPEFGMYLNQTGRPIVYSCSWPAYQEDKGVTPNFEALKKYCNLWRNYQDIDDSWISVLDIMDYYAEHQDMIARHAGPGHWNDPDMLIVGNFGLSIDQAKAQMAVWAILAAPLFMSTDLNTIRPEFAKILLNREVIAVNQDPMGIQGRRIYKKKKIDIWRRPILPCELGYYSYAVAFVSLRVDGTPYYIMRTLYELGLYNPNGYLVKDLFCGTQKTIMGGSIRVKVNPSGVVFLKFTSLPDNPPEEYIDAVYGLKDKKCSQDVTFFND